ncbi:MAG: hypothetical protein WC587_03550, partial [Candidatus Paceibacterota bacterium]
MKNIWILTEERPKANVIKTILEKFASDNSFKINSKKELRVVPILKDNCFTFTYKVEGITCNHFGSVFIKIASGNSSFVDFLVF